ncbi:hypothetical protein N0V93_000690 [Gnomoniopsis smithogilvyi]|uniref:Uncharacterized protein n=1 Tax=Gnomoniopsis smithogilvyi TaxID=1191159 RepID=A0A9W9D200_9PEZI|nr:hypothetical protein N0V93_000690 [Gnomoniopsis smithogilvyi]
MPAINNALISRDTISHIAKRENWAQKEAGVVVVFAIVFVVAAGLIGTGKNPRPAGLFTNSLKGKKSSKAVRDQPK